MKPPRAVVLDLGKVLVDFDYHITARALAPHCAVTMDQLRRLLDQSRLLHRYECGELSTPDFFAAVKAASGFRGGLAEFGALFGDIFTPIAPMIDLHASLAARGVPTFAFSNTNELAVRHLRERFGFMGKFTGLVLSFEHGAMKPDARLYAALERTSGLRGMDLLYLDDRPENIAAALERGWRAVLHESPPASIAAVKQAGLPC
jgi:FMN phosphatase YigB (HAD superfamily)